MDKMRRRYNRLSATKRAYIAGLRKGKKIGKRIGKRMRWRR